MIDVAAISGVDLLGDGRSAVAADFDNDGHLDLLVRAVQKPKLTLLRNEGPWGGSVEVRLKGRAMGIGSLVTVKIGDRTQVHPVLLGSGFLAAGPVGAHVGLGAATHADEVKVRFPSGKTAVAHDVPAGAIVEATEGIAEARVTARKSSSVLLGGAAPAPRPLLSLDGVVASLTDASRNQLPRRSAPASSTVVNLWATWCKPCLQELPELSKWAAAHPDRPVLTIAVDVSLDQARAHLDKLGVQLPVAVLAPTGLARLGLDADGLPATYLFARDGKLQRGFLGTVDVRALLR